MKTEQLIALLAQDRTKPRPTAPRLVRGMAVALAVSAAAVLAVLGLRTDLADAMTDPATAPKWLLPLLLAVLAGLASLRLSRPQTDRVPALWVVAGIATLAGLVLIGEWRATPVALRWTEMRGHSILPCLTSIIAMATLPLIAALHALRDGASLRPGLSGAAAGLAAGAAATVAYAFHCDEDAPLFYLTWYGLAILTMTAFGWLAGRRVLRW